MKQPKKRRAPRAPFIVTVAATSALALPLLAGCSSSVKSDECPPGAECNPPEVEVCPEEVPNDGAPCSYEALHCEYPPGDWCPTAVATCTDEGTWDVEDRGRVVCNPPEIRLCPDELPVEGAPCSHVALHCDYPPHLSCPDQVAACTEGGTWEVNDMTDVTCNPPPVPPCDLLTTAAECKSSERSCRWLVPGCAEPNDPVPALAEAGCFEAVPCVDNDFCSPGLVCAERVFDPCHGQACQACGQTEMLCVAP
ncbi:hypothetical protein [Chondromyces crocatus]|uniref:Uncharacterized protein n=1 Tax=Chondromyces crocatus TaxID=52 RepID=A0A0K1EF58_CHOCO|nr:hypothetical protein [Chondromyces crocatus]AKT39327.1 uncharacterized protein CMC5_034740 [Chondromyces crocatus]